MAALVCVASCRLSLLAASRGYFLAAACGLLISVASLRGEACGEWALELAGSVVVARRLSCSEACGIFLDQRANPSPVLAGGFLTTGPPGKSSNKV